MANQPTKPFQIKVPLNNNPLLKQIITVINENIEIQTLWNVININAIDRMHITDHGPVHFQIVANSGIRLLRILIKHGVIPSVVKDFHLTPNHAEVIVFLGCVLHDIGMTINRRGHEEFSVMLANNLLHKALEFLPPEERIISISETLHAILSHRSDGEPLTVEAGVVRVADALDMSQGRSRIPYEAGSVNIHSLSAYAIEKVEIKEGTVKPIQINIRMNNSAGIFQIDELLKEKLKGSGIEEYFEISAVVEGETEKKLIKEYHIGKK